MAKHKHADLMIAYANDSSLKFERQYPSGEWGDTGSLPNFNPDLTYRIKPSPKRAFVYMVKASNSSEYYPQSFTCLDHAKDSHNNAIQFGYTVTDIKEVEWT